jgi:hypothetical protein
MKHGKIIRYIIDHLTEINFDTLAPVESTVAKSKVSELILQWEVTAYIKCRDQYIAKNKDGLYSIICGQCSEVLQDKLEDTKEYEDYAPISCPIGLLKHISKQVSLKFENVTYHAAAADDAKVAFYAFYQTKQNPLHQYCKELSDLTDTLEHYGADIGIDLSLAKDAAVRNDKKDSNAIDNQHTLQRFSSPSGNSCSSIFLI